MSIMSVQSRPEFTSSGEFTWPDDFARIPDEEWTRLPVDEFGLNYDDVGNHGWYKNLEPTIAQVLAALAPGDLLVDYSSGTGILTRRLLERIGHPVGILNVDASPKFLRVALETFRDDERVAFRLLRWLRAEKRLQSLDEVAGPELIARGADAVTSTNAIHLYHDLDETLASWSRILRPGGLAFVCSGNMRNPNGRPGEWIIDETVARVNEIAADVVRTEPAFAEYRETLGDAALMSGHAKLREKVFVPVRPLDLYLEAFRDGGFTVLHVFEETIFARIDEWYKLLSTYHDGVLSWVGGSEKVEGRPPSDEAVRQRLFLIRYGLEKLFPGQDSFPCTWTYLTCRRLSPARVTGRNGSAAELSVRVRSTAMRDVYVAGVGMTRFAKQPGRSLKDLTAEAVNAAMKDAGQTAGEVQSCYVGNAVAGSMTGQEMLAGQFLLRPLGLGGIPVFNVENACASASTAFHLGWQAVATGADFARVVVKNQRHGMLNPAAQYGGELTIEQVLAGRDIVWPFTLQMCSPISDGAAAALLVSEEFRPLGDTAVAVLASVVRSAPADGTTSVTGLAASAAYEAAGLGPADLDCVEVHDAAASAELVIYEQLGLTDPGGGAALIRSGETALGGSLPVNTSGGLLARGHPIGATGLGQIVEVVWQLQGKAGKRQVENCKVGLTQNGGGHIGFDAAAMAVHLFSV